MKIIQSYSTLCDPMDFTVHGILQARMLEWVAVPFSKGSSQPRDRTLVSRIAGGFFTSWATREAHVLYEVLLFFFQNKYSGVSPDNACSSLGWVLDIPRLQMWCTQSLGNFEAFDKLFSGWLEIMQWVCFPDPSMKIVALPVWWDSVDEVALGN